ncbi:hypothetical protein GW17_00030415, partial [Ensete ventricosum]
EDEREGGAGAQLTWEPGGADRAAHAVQTALRTRGLRFLIVRVLCEKAKEVLMEESNVQCPDTNYLFMGDYVDRGYYSVETVTVSEHLCSYYAVNKNSCLLITQVYGFYDECLRNYLIMKTVSLCLCRLNLKYFVYMVDYPHLLRPLIAYVTLIVFKRFHMRVPCVIFCGLTLMTDVVGVFPLVVLDILLAKYNSMLLCFLAVALILSILNFCNLQDISEQFNHTNNLKLIARAHQLVMEGYNWGHVTLPFVVIFHDSSALSFGGPESELSIPMA